jgi:fused signal recognition particle receptor
MFTLTKKWIGSIKSGLAKTSFRLNTAIKDIFKGRIDATTLEELEDALICTDMGAATAKALVATIAHTKCDNPDDVTPIVIALKQAITDILAPYAIPLPLAHSPFPLVVMVCGVNGNGKTTTIAKLAHHSIQSGKKVMVAACDTFRAAAVEQLAIWAKRAGAECIVGPEKADPASVAYHALEQAKKQAVDILFIDTAGRLHNKQNLMDELTKITAVLKKIDSNTPHHILLVLDATTGQNAMQQVAAFQKMIGITGLIITKLDGSAKAGVVVGLAREFKLPIHAIGVGEAMDDLQPFTAEAFADALLAE